MFHDYGLNVLRVFRVVWENIKINRWIVAMPMMTEEGL